MKENARFDWPATLPDAEQPLALQSFAEWQESDYEQDGIVAVTDGWRDGPLAAVLRGGINARAVLDLLARSLPLRIERTTRYWVTVTRRPSGRVAT